MTAPEPRPSGADGNARGLLVLAAAVVVGFLLLWNLGGGSTSSADTKDESSTPNTTAPLDGTTTEATTTTLSSGSGHTASEVKVLVLNGGGPTGAAKSTSTQIGESGYTMGEPGNSPITVDATSIFYAEDYQADATSIALLLGRSTDALKPLADAGLNGAEGDANVVVVLGPDAPPVSEDSSSTTTTTAAN